jgi:hypothetical protein
MSLRPTNQADRAPPTILSHPLAIHDAVTALFPLATVNMTIEPKIKVEIDISPKVTPMTLEYAVDRKNFVDILNQIKLHLVVNNPTKLPVDTNDFSLTQKPLTNWQKYKRFMWEKSGGNCVNCIFCYLMDKPEDAISLGFAPDQVDTNPTEEDLFYFKQIPRQLECKDKDMKADYIRIIKKSYPNISKIIYPP